MIRESVLDGGRHRTWLRIIAGWIATAFRGCKLLVPPPSPHGHQELNRVLIALRLCANIAELRLLILPLRIEETDNARTAAAIIDALQTYRLRGHRQRVLLSNQEIRIMLECLQDVRDLPKSLQYRLLVVGRRFLKRSKRSTTFCHFALSSVVCAISRIRKSHSGLASPA